MMRICDGTDPNLVDQYGVPCSCGLTFDDVDTEVVYPHTRIPDREEKSALWDKVQASIGVPYVWGSGTPTERAELEP